MKINLTETVVGPVWCPLNSPMANYIPMACNQDLPSSKGDMVQVVYRDGTDTTPLWENTTWYWNGFTGFRI